MSRADLSLSEARRIALAAQGFDRPRSAGRIDIRHVRRVVSHVELLQIDTVNVLVRAHYMPLFSRLGPYPMSLLDDAAYARRELFETWAHAASLARVERYPLLRRRMDGDRRYQWMRRWAEQNARYVDAVLDEVRRRGPITAAELEDPGRRGGEFWVRTQGKVALEWLFLEGAVLVAARPNFARVYDLAERVLPREVLERTAPDEPDAQRKLLPGLVEEGKLHEVSVEGWKERAYLHPEAQTPRAIDARALLTPFDSLIWDQNRRRTERLFGFRYVLEIYLPEQQRRYGYYVLPFLLGDRLVARVDLKADRRGRKLLVKAAYVEEGESERMVAGHLAAELALLARWLELDKVQVERRGDFASALARAVGANGGSS